MNFADGSFLETDMIVFSAGIRPQDALARQFGLEIGERGGIVVNNYCQTSDENIYAIGECALWSGRIFGLVSPGYTMAKVAACHIAGDCEEFVGADMSTKLKLLGVDVASIGDAHGRTEGSLSYSYYDEAEQIYKSVVVSADGKKLLGAVLVGDVADYGAWLQMMLNDLDIPSCPEELLLPKEDVVFDVESLPEEALICACNSVTKGQIESAVDAGARDMEAIKNQTLASTGCGSCGALAEQVFEAKMASLGYEVGGPADAVSGVYLSGLSGASLSPEKLLQLGAITQEFNLTTQLACDNRLQLVGVEPEQLSALQRRLNAAGLI